MQRSKCPACKRTSVVLFSLHRCPCCTNSVAQFVAKDGHCSPQMSGPLSQQRCLGAMHVSDARVLLPFAFVQATCLSFTSAGLHCGFFLYIGRAALWLAGSLGLPLSSLPGQRVVPLLVLSCEQCKRRICLASNMEGHWQSNSIVAICLCHTPRPCSPS